MTRANDRTISVIGLGYVGLPVAVSFGRHFPTIGFDIDTRRIEELRKGVDRNLQVDREGLAASTVRFTTVAEDLRSANFHIVTVPTPVDAANRPDLGALISASRTVGSVLKRGDIVVFESTVYPGATEDDCVPVLEETSGLRAGSDFKVGYSPERINPGDPEHKFEDIRKVVSAQDAESLEVVASTYGAVVRAGIHRASSIKVAEAAKVIENTQRDLNIALMNELAVIFDRMAIDTHEVLEAASTKWNFVRFRPGLVGGHCIGVDPYYLTHKAEKLGYHPEVILAGRRINDGMGRFVAQRTIKEMIRRGHDIARSTVSLLGLTFKEDCPDLRNTRVIDIVRELREYGVRVQIHDPAAEAAEAQREHGVALRPWEEMERANAVVVAVAHRMYRELSVQKLASLMGDNPVLIDVKGIYDPQLLRSAGIAVWRL